MVLTEILDTENRENTRVVYKFDFSKDTKKTFQIISVLLFKYK